MGGISKANVKTDRDQKKQPLVLSRRESTIGPRRMDTKHGRSLGDPPFDCSELWLCIHELELACPEEGEHSREPAYVGIDNWASIWCFTCSEMAGPLARSLLPMEPSSAPSQSSSFNSDRVAPFPLQHSHHQNTFRHATHIRHLRFKNFGGRPECGLCG